MQKLCHLRVGIYTVMCSNDFVASGIDVGPRFGRDAREQGDAVSSAFFGCHNLDFVPVNIRLDLPP